ncbi:MAG: hypothetical protein A4S12_06980 [Proteobacteria bacterium SG_bin5]|nr:phage tail tape measure protein [Sphingomonas sp.]OQW42076.1 MAG: hypothetical protein A4S12_06980 [Proteobacteria bacterium SG_bin5]
MADRKLAITVLFGAIDRLGGPLRSLTASAKAFGGATAETTRKLAALKAAQAQIGGYKVAEQRLRETATALDGARAKAAELRAELAASDDPPKRLAIALEKTEAAAKKLAERHERQGEALQRLSRGLGAAGVDVAELGKHEEQLGHRIYETTSQLKRQEDALRRRAAIERAGAGLRSAGGKLAAAGAVATVAAAPLYGAANDAREFQSIIVDIGQKANLSAEATKRISDNLLRVGPKIAQLPTDLARGVDTLAGLGLDPQLAARLIAPIGRAATAYKAEITDLSSATYSAVDNLKVPIGQVARTLDVMAQAGKDGAFELKDMAAQFPALTAAAAGLGQRGVGAIADLAAAAQIARKGAGDSGTAANNLLNLLNKINAKETAGNFSKFGINLQAELQKAAKVGKSPIEAIIEQTIRATKGDLSKLSYLFGDAQVQAALRPLVADLADYRKIRADALKATGTVEADFQGRISKDGAAAQRKFNAQLERLQVVAGNLLLPTLTRLLEVTGNFVDGLSAWADRNPVVAQGLATIFSAVGPVLTVLGTVGSFIGFLGGGLANLIGWFTKLGTVFTWLRTAAQFVAPVFGALAAAIGLPVWATVALVGALVGAVYLIYRYWTPISAFFGRLWAGITAAFGQGVSYLRGLVPSWGQIGRFMLQALLTALDPGAVARHVMALGAQMISAIKGVLGIKSPSRVFAAIGGHMMAGLSQGLDRGGGGPVSALQRQAGRLVGAAAGSALALSPGGALAARPGASAGPAAGGGAAPVINNYTIQVSAGGESDPKDLARKIMAEIERLNAARGRAAYRDDA